MFYRVRNNEGGFKDFRTEEEAKTFAFKAGGKLEECFDKIPCDYCGGSGVIEEFIPQILPDGEEVLAYHEEECPECEGEGVVDDAYFED